MNIDAVQPKVLKMKDGKEVKVVTYTQAMMVVGCKDKMYLRQKVAKGKIALVGREPQAPGSDVMRALLSWEDVIAVGKAYTPRSESEGFSVELKVDEDQWAELKPILEKLEIEWKDLTAARREYHQKRRAAKKAQGDGDVLAVDESDDELGPDVRA